MNEINFLNADESLLPEICNRILHEFYGCKVFLLSGEPGAGKTTLVRNFCSILGVTDEVCSPTYTIINEYHTRTGEKIYHIDLYRLKNKEEAVEAGVIDILDRTNWTFIEWYQILSEYIDRNAVIIKMEKTEDAKRNIFAEYLK
ncbi:MAG: tRNA (adenosine(37)-N6)-threonylcarbamoyltransferase complex ATPase subunit type 1 TsaE [Chitinophagales bacterium]|nr:tRNA (adenosine(37)-N6)-threonylcarbamoyltransferase complex ATPase subunit type 1 TsaE [Chitinophagales bacterium]